VTGTHSQKHYTLPVFISFENANDLKNWPRKELQRLLYSSLTTQVIQSRLYGNWYTFSKTLHTACIHFFENANDLKNWPRKELQRLLYSNLTIQVIQSHPYGNRYTFSKTFPSTGTIFFENGNTGNFYFASFM
jgi:hypothetical protein